VIIGSYESALSHTHLRKGHTSAIPAPGALEDDASGVDIVLCDKSKK
jgi:hypothetical protein